MSQKFFDLATTLRASFKGSFFSIEDAHGGLGGFAGISRANIEGTVAYFLLLKGTNHDKRKVSYNYGSNKNHLGYLGCFCS